MKFLNEKLNNQQGMALVAVIIIFIVLVIFTSTVVAMVYSDTELSFDDENGKKAYYAARSAIEATQKAILNEINELSTEKGTIATNLRDKINALNEKFKSGVITTQVEYDAEFELILQSYDSQIQDYKNSYSDFVGTVLPFSGTYIHKVTINGFETDSPDFDVAVTPIMAGSSIDAYRLETQATVKGTTIKVAKWLGATIGAEDSITLSSLDQQPPGRQVFDDAIYSYGDLRFGTGGGAAKAQVTGGITYEGALTNGDNVVSGSLPYHQTLKTAVEDIPEPASLLPIKPDSLQKKGSVLPATISASDNGYYTGNVQWKENYTVNTSSGDVVLKFTQVTTTKDYSFYVTGGHDFYIYILDSVNPGVCIDSKASTNNSQVIDCAATTPNTYLIIDQPAGQRDTATNTINFDFGKNQTTMEAYIYAPYTSMEFKNNFDFTGAIVAGGYDIWNKTSITYKEPANNPPMTDPGFITVDYTIDLAGTREVTYMKGSYWLKN